VLILADTACIGKEMGCKGVKISRDGSRVKWIRVNDMYFCDIKRVLSPGTSLDALGKMCQLPVEKGIMPWDKFTSLSYLREKTLPSDAADWRSSLQPDRSPSQSDVDAALQIFRENNYSCIGDYLKSYVSKDVDILQKAIVKLSRSFYKQLGVNFLGLRKHTISSLSNTAAHSFLLRNKRPGIVSCQHSKYYSIMKHGLRGGKRT
jgi:hypothetical protein